MRRFLHLSKTAARLVRDGRLPTMVYGVKMQLMGFDLASVELEALGLDPQRSFHYGNSGGPELRRVLRALDIPAGGRIVDLGCGKAGAMLTMAEFPFREIVGVDLSPEMIRIAGENCARAGITKRVRLLETDAAEFTDFAEVDHLYLYHPFQWVVLKSICANISESLGRKEKRVSLIYKNPVLHDELLRTGLFRLQQEFKFPPAGHDWNSFRIYVHEPFPPAGNGG
jgi:SAM-dependent methyltransferase